jgi:hypothetical protein
MKTKIFIQILIVYFIATLYTGCSQTPLSPDKNQDGTLLYQVEIPDMDLDSVHIMLKIDAWEQGDSIRLIAPPVYADNPYLVQTGTNFCHFTVTDCESKPVACNFDSILVGSFNSLAISFPVITGPVFIEYYVKFLYETDSTHTYMPIPYIDQNSGYLQGNYLFIIPRVASNTANIWRDNFDIQVFYSLGNDVSIFGDPDPLATFSNPYQLMFSTSTLIASSIVNNQILFEGEASGQRFRCVNISPDKTFAANVITKTKNDFITILNDISPKFGIIDETPFTMITGINYKIGLEGMFAFCCKDLHDNDVSGSISVCMAHEFMHAWIGVRVGDYEDPWWKEGTTSYLGHLITQRNKLAPRSTAKGSLLDSLAGSGNASGYALSDEEIRSILFYGDGIGHLVYGKGAQVSMLLDRRIRENTQYKTTLVTILAEFIRQFDGKSFTRNEYVSFINERSDCDVTDIFDQYVDTPGPIPGSVLRENYDSLEVNGVFGDTIQ